MADKAISELIAAERITATDMFVLEQNGTAKKLTGQVLLNWLTAAADGHGGIQSIVKRSTSGLVDTYRITLADTTYFDFMVTNGRAITSVKQINVSGLTHTYEINFNDGGTQTFAVTDGRGITEIAKTSTSGLVDTYTISLNDGTSETFTVTNGEKGDKGDNTYTWIKYSSQKPTASSHSFGDVADDWIGIYYGTSATAPTDWQQYEWFQIKGEKGDPGVPATLVSSATDYQASDSGTVTPSGTWSPSVPVVAQGKYLWTRTTNTFNTGSPAVSYSVSRMGIDGSGSVTSVANISPDEYGNVPLTATDINALPSTGGDLTGELRMNGQSISGLNVPTANDQAANMGFVNQQVKKAAPRNLLDNSDFTNPVNQRKRDSYPVEEEPIDRYTIDRWEVGAYTEFYLASDGIILTDYGCIAIEQVAEVNVAMCGKKFTGAVCLGDDTVILCTGTFPVSESSDVYQWFAETKTEDGLWIEMGKTPKDNNLIFKITLYSSEGATLKLKWAVVYEGEYTAETLPEYCPKGYGAELIECMRYYQTVQVLAGTDVYTSRRQFITLPFPMRVIPTYTTALWSGEEAQIQVQNNRTLDVTGGATWSHVEIFLSADF